MLKPVIITPPDPEKPLVSLEDAKAHCRVDHVDDDALITSLVSAATSYLDGYSGILGRALLYQVWMQPLSCWPIGGVRFPLAPSLGMDSVQYYDVANQLTTLDASNFRVIEDTLSPIVAWTSTAQLPALYNRPDPVRVAMNVGYGEEPEDVPEAIRLAVKMLVGHFYENREATIVGTTAQELPFAVSALIAPFRRVGV